MEESILSKIEEIYNNKSKKAIIYIDGDNGVGKNIYCETITKKNKI